MASPSSQPRQQSISSFVMRGGGGGGPPDGGGGGGGEAAFGEEAAAARRPAYAKGHQGKFMKGVVENINECRWPKHGRRPAGSPMLFDGAGSVPLP